jgi:tellurite resistance protein TerA
MTRSKSSLDSIKNANKSNANLSAHGNAVGAAGVKESSTNDIQDLLDKNGESNIISPPEGGFGTFKIGLAWTNVIVEQSTGFMGLIKKATKQGVDLDLGCFFELNDGTRGILQPFGDLYGNFDALPYISLSGDNRTGEGEGHDEAISINGTQWSKIKRVLVYCYIYKGPNDWSQIKPHLDINLSDEENLLAIEPRLKTNDLSVCALASMKNIKDGLQIVTHGEYFVSQAAMDRAFGFGLKWEDGAKD